MADCGDILVYGLFSGIGSGLGAGATALVTTSSVAGGALTGFTFTAVSFGTALALDYFGIDEITGIALSVLAGAAASVAAPSLLGYSITLCAIAIVDLLIAAIAVGYFACVG